MAIHVTGAAELHRLAAACFAESGGRRVTGDIARGMNGAQGSIRAAVVESVLAKLPKRGRLNAWVAEARITFRPIWRASAAGVNVRVGKAGHDLRGLDEGLVIHPFYGHSPWYNQAVVPNTISTPIRDEGGDALERAIEEAASAMAERIARA